MHEEIFIPRGKNLVFIGIHEREKIKHCWCSQYLISFLFIRAMAKSSWSPIKTEKITRYAFGDAQRYYRFIRGANIITSTRDFSVQFCSNQNERNILDLKNYIFSAQLHILRINLRKLFCPCCVFITKVWFNISFFPRFKLFRRTAYCFGYCLLGPTFFCSESTMKQSESSFLKNAPSKYIFQ